MHDTVIVRYGEISLKGDNRGFFEKKLVENIKKQLQENRISYSSVARPRGRIIIETNQKCSCLKNVFGITSFSHATSTEPETRAMKKAALPLIKKLAKNKSFRVTTQRVDKSIQLRSNDIDREIGSFVVDKTNAKVDLTGFDFELGIELFNSKAYLFTERIQGPGGLPVGVEGTVLVLKGRDSAKAAMLMQKRGCETIVINKLSDAAKYSRAKALVVSQTLKNLKPVKTNLVVLRPLI